MAKKDLLRRSIRTSFLIFACIQAHAEWSVLPEAKHQPYQTYGLFMDHQSALLHRHGPRMWAAIGGAFPLVEKTDLETKPQLVLIASVNASYYLVDNVLNSETLDSRMGLFWDTTLGEHWLVSFGYIHTSGHAGDDIMDVDLLKTNVGIETLPIRCIYASRETWRAGMSIAPHVSSVPATKVFDANQFFEWFPWGYSGSYQKPTPYFAFGIEEFGRDYIQLSEHGQIGAYFGNHLERKHYTSARVVLGGYNGPDPKMKYYLYKNRWDRFAYMGLMFEL